MFKVIIITLLGAAVIFAIAFRIFLDLDIPLPSSAPTRISIPQGAIEKPVMITPEEAIAEAHKVPGFENGDVLEVQALLNEKGEIQYWLVKTRNGTVTVSAEPPPPKIVIPPNTKIEPAMITALEAARRVHEIKGYENEEILEVFGLVDENGNLQYWSVKTSKGFVTIEARQ